MKAKLFRKFLALMISLCELLQGFQRHTSLDSFVFFHFGEKSSLALALSALYFGPVMSPVAGIWVIMIGATVLA